MDAGHVDDHARRPLSDQRPRRLASAEEGAGHVDVEDAAPLRQRHLGQRERLLDAGVVDEQVNRPAKLGPGPPEHLDDLLLD